MSSEDQLAKKTLAAGCPVPFEQQPLNEYRDLQESWFFRWGTCKLRHYVMRIIWIWVWCWIIAGPIAASSFPLSRHPAQFVLVGAAGALVIPILALTYLYVGWLHVYMRLSSATVVYEESGWYDGQSWIKPPEVVAQDRLVVTYQVQPVLQRIQWTLVTLTLLLLTGVAAWQFL